jgi:hypothetical protein
MVDIITLNESLIIYYFLGNFGIQIVLNDESHHWEGKAHSQRLVSLYEEDH